MSQEKSTPSEKISGWDSATVSGKGVRLRFLRPGDHPGKLESDAWVTLTAKQCEALADELLQESKKI